MNRARIFYPSIFLVLLAPFAAVPRARGGCADLVQMAARVEGLRPGSPVRVASVRGNPYEGVVENVMTAPDGRRVLSLRGADGNVRSLYFDQLNPASFSGPYESLIEGMPMTVASRSGNTYSGTYRGSISDADGTTRIMIEDGNGRVSMLDRSRLDESSLRATAPAAVRPPVPTASAVSEVNLASGRVATSGSDSYISFQGSPSSIRGSGRVTRMWRDPAGQIHLEVEELNPMTGLSRVRELTADEIANARVSSTARANFESRLAATRRPPPPRIGSGNAGINRSIAGEHYLPDRIFRDWGHPAVEEGFKLHVSATAENAGEVAEAILPELRRRGIAHKVVGSIDDYESVMTGTQRGKFITVYPSSPAEAAEVAAALDRIMVERGLSGYRVPDERILGTSGTVSVRYGGYTRSRIRGPDGVLVPDVRGGGWKPDWIPDPFAGMPSP